MPRFLSSVAKCTLWLCPKNGFSSGYSPLDLLYQTCYYISPGVCKGEILVSLRKCSKGLVLLGNLLK